VHQPWTPWFFFKMEPPRLCINWCTQPFIKNLRFRVPKYYKLSAFLLFVVVLNNFCFLHWIYLNNKWTYRKTYFHCPYYVGGKNGTRKKLCSLDRRAKFESYRIVLNLESLAKYYVHTHCKFIWFHILINFKMAPTIFTNLRTAVGKLDASRGLQCNLIRYNYIRHE
jgi:hypothetical protein